jgi:hypothetical protein
MENCIVTEPSYDTRLSEDPVFVFPSVSWTRRNRLVLKAAKTIQQFWDAL